MPIPRQEPDLMQRSQRRQLILIVAIAVAFPAMLMLIGQAGYPELGIVVVALVFPALFVVNYIRNTRTREGTDERAWENHRRAASFSWQIVAFATAGALVWTGVRHGYQAAQPYLYLLLVQLLSYVGALSWRRWQGR
ncbi:MAG TPA: hypothetical protein VK453_17075 [Micromonosporaceae bacterium]|nr:hypothetical protein [Micromonosporaceae bacterium]